MLRNVCLFDFKIIRRDLILLVLLVVPLIIVLLCRYALPWLSLHAPLIVDFYNPLVLLFSVLNAMFPAFIIAFVLLDEKDLHLHSVIKVTPVSLNGMLKARLFILFIVSFLGSLVLIIFNGIYYFPFIDALSIAILSALSAPILTLLIAAIAKNKVEGLTLLKVANITLLIPLLSIFIQSPWEYLLGIFPAFWVFQAYEPLLNQYLMFCVGGILILLMNYFAFKFAIKRLVA